MAVDKHYGKFRYRIMRGGVLHIKAGFETEDEAIIAEAKIRAKATKINMDFVKLCESRLEDIELNRSVKHFRENKTLIVTLIEAGWREERQITRQHVKDFLYNVATQEKNKARGKKMANKRLKLIKALFNHGIEEELIDYNPCLGIKPYSVTPKKRYVPPKKDIDAVVKNAGDLKPYIIAVKNTLGRASELDNLTWEDVNLENQFLTLSTRKAKNSDLTSRNININGDLLEVLESLPRDDDLVFPYPDGINVIYWHRFGLLQKICKNVGIKSFGFHSFRHYGASKLAEAGVALTEIQQILGHANLQTTIIYIRSLTSTSKGTMDLLS